MVCLIVNSGKPEWVKLRMQSWKVNKQFLKKPENEVCCIYVVCDLHVKDVIRQHDMMVQYVYL